MRGKIMAPVIVVAVITLMGFGIAYFFVLRFEAGDIYPPYSSLRSDPLGAKVFYESLKLCEGMTAERNFEHLLKTKLTSDTVLFLLGTDTEYSRNRDSIPAMTAGAINSFVRKGGRLVITFLPRNLDPTSRHAEIETEEERSDRLKRVGGDRGDERGTRSAEGGEGKAEGGTGNGERGERNAERGIGNAERERGNGESGVRKAEGEKKKDKDEDDDDVLTDSAIFRSFRMTNWLELAFAEDPLTGPARAKLGAPGKTPGLPASISCHTSTFFTNAAADWQTIYERDGKPVIVEKKVGKGTVVLSTLTYFVSNEAMKNERHPALLAWLAGGKKRVVFDEYQHGVGRETNMAVLMRKYHLEWLGAGLLLLGALFVWQKSVSIVPLRGSEVSRGSAESADFAEGKDSRAGLVNILRRNISRQKVLEASVTEWRKTACMAETDPRMGEIETILLKSGDPLVGRQALVASYNEICGVLKKTSRKAAAKTGRT